MKKDLKINKGKAMHSQPNTLNMNIKSVKFIYEKSLQGLF